MKSSNPETETKKTGGLMGKLVGGALLALGVSFLVNKTQGKKTAVSDSETEALHELLLFVNDRVEGYQRAVDESQDTELRGYYKQLVSQSQQFSNSLNQHLRQLGGGRETSTTLKGKLYRRWMDAKALLTGTSEKAILGSNVYGEEWALKAYKEALDSQALTGQLRQEVERQYGKSQQTYDKLKNLQAK
ncbi:PA2169 family four-helix-bundle protein [Hymenobacter rubripertinctus]|uniref:PA2169 family four-helix-bundle protein n=1 Tax=Hymenobacter rubripertinctus TaxID=2029981 RepID=A0A418QXY6_9BACT|nr:PA2169 family four-helix-bundle protein [Hymenobacter rubripertinctus]RIY10008.1 PA2169 family four-helix-bundle protein [Hymenobacter rubripertinctus]